VDVLGGWAGRDRCLRDQWEHMNGNSRLQCPWLGSWLWVAPGRCCSSPNKALPYCEWERSCVWGLPPLAWRNTRQGQGRVGLAGHYPSSVMHPPAWWHRSGSRLHSPKRGLCPHRPAFDPCCLAPSIGLESGLRLSLRPSQARTLCLSLHLCRLQDCLNLCCLPC